MTLNPLLQKIQFKSLVLDNRILQAPLAGYANASFRLACWLYGRPGLLATEMISARAIVKDCERTKKYLLLYPEEGPVLFQLWGREPEYLAFAAKKCQEAGAAVVDLNCGCPVRKIKAAGAGAALMHEPKQIGKCLEAMRKVLSIPLSVKIRLGPTPAYSTCLEVAKISEEAGVDFLTVHGRYGGESYNCRVRSEEIARIAEKLHIPLFANGNVRCGKSALDLSESTGATGVMVGRACLGNPWIFAQIKTELKDQSWQEPLPKEKQKVVMENFCQDIEFYGEYRAVRHFRKLACFYSHGITGSREFRQEINHCDNRDAFMLKLERFFI